MKIIYFAWFIGEDNNLFVAHVQFCEAINYKLIARIIT